jgi:probable biosynthetic protein (TIGR04098 family)
MFSETLSRRQYALNMPQMHWGGMSENWLQKELGDMHWSMTSDGLGVRSDELCDSDGNRLYASFVRLRWESTASLSSFAENQQVMLNSKLSRYGSKMFFSNAEITCGNDKINASLISVFSARTDQDNKTLKKGTLSAPGIANIHTVETLPDFARQYLAAKASLFTAEGKPHDFTIELAGASFQLNASPVHTQDYKIEPFDDVNGVGLLYFASYSKISDKCERIYFQQNNSEDDMDWAQKSSCIARDILYFGNANPNEELVYELNSWQLIENNRIQLLSSLYRKADGQLISRILTIKQLSAPATNLPVQHKPLVGEAKSSVKYTRDTINKSIIQFFSTALQVNDLRGSTNLKSIGIESILFTELSEYLARQFQLKSNASRFFGLSTIDDITSDLLGENGTQKKTSADPTRSGEKITGATEDIAIIGTSLRLPGAINEDEFWELLVRGQSAVSDTPAERWSWPDWINTETTHKGINKGGYLENIDEFDAAFFRISPKEAELMDPQQRLLLELTWQLIETSGYKPASQKGTRTGVYIGASSSDYELFLNDHKDPQTLSGTGTSLAVLANRISYFFDLEGPSLQIDTACSSSLAAVHNAVQAIKRGECTQAIAGGIHLMCHPARSMAYYKSNMLSTDGLCMTFDENANGYVRGEGCVLLFLKTLSQAISDGDNIKGIIKGTAINHGGQTAGLTMPDPRRQSRLLEDAYSNAGIDISSVSYIETHGTGTSLGDPIEVAGLTSAFKNLQPQSLQNVKPWCGLGSVKTNIGHLEAASGLAGLLKVLLSMEHGYLPATINFERLNSKIELQGSPFYIQKQGSPWQPLSADMPLRAGVSSFGIGGTNVHVVLESFRLQREQLPQHKTSGAPYFFVLSARNADRLRAYAQCLMDHIRKHAGIDHADLCYTLQVTREEMAERMAVAYNEPAQLTDALADYIQGVHSPGIFTGNISRSKPAETFADTEAIKERVNTGDAEKIASYWCSGGMVDWNLLYTQSIPKKIDLPSYPFKREKYWFKNRNNKIETAAQRQEPLPGPQLKINNPIVERMELTAIASKLSDAVCDILYLDRKELNVNASFIEMGLDSILGMELIKKVNGIFNTGIKTSKIYDHPSVAELSAYVYQIVNTSPGEPAYTSAPGKIKLEPTDAFTLVMPSAPQNVNISLPEPEHDAVEPSLQNNIREIESILSEAVCDLLYLDRQELAPGVSFNELGLDSVLGIELIKSLNRRFNTNLKASRLYDHPTVESLASYIHTNLKDESIPSTKEGASIDKDLVLYYEISTANNAFLRDHLVFGYHVLPTDAYLELLYTALKQHLGLGSVSLEGIRIHEPVLAHSNDVRTLKLELKQMTDGLRFIISSKAGMKEQVHVRGFVNTANKECKPLLKGPDMRPDASFTTNELRTVVKGAEIKGCYDGVRRSLVFKGSYGIGKLMVCTEEGNLLQSSIAQVLDGALLFAIQAGAREFGNNAVSNAIYLPYQVNHITINGQAFAGQTYTCVLHCYKKGLEEALVDFEVTGEDGKLLFCAKGLELRPVTESQLTNGRAVQFVKELGAQKGQQKKINGPLPEESNDVALIGLSCRLPGADNVMEYWHNLTQGVDSIEEINEECWDGYHWYNPDVRSTGTSYSKWGGFIKDKDKFDALFFGISPYEAEIMDPQQRLFLEESWKALEDAAYNPKALARKKVSVFVGAGMGDYLHLMHQHGSGKEGAAFTGSSQAVLSARISYLLNITGPSLAIDTACSSSLVAVDRAYRSILSGESEMALAGGVALLNTPMLHVWTSQVGMPSSEGRCKAFDDSADGIVSSEGIGVVVLKKLEAAERDGDRIYAVIKASGINQDGKTNGITAPSARSQAELQTAIFQQYGIDPSTIGYVEAHGTGTKLGDPIEIDALTDSFSRYTSAKQYCAIGSVKTNIGHTSFAAGVAGLIKAALMLKHGKYLPSLHYNNTNTEIDIKNTPFYVNTELKDWVANPAHPRRAAISSFGFSGTNAHIVIEEYQCARKEVKTVPAALVILSAKDAERLQEQVRNLMNYLEINRQLNIRDIAYTLQVGREPMEIRLAFEAKDTSHLIAALGNYLAGEKSVAFSGDAKLSDGFLLEGRAGKAYIETAIETCECRSLAQLWVRGVNIDWNLLYPAEKPNKISLPAYPFARERHWISKNATSVHQQAVHKLHPLLHLNNSTLREQKYKSVFTGNESLLRDHIVLEQKVLPGAAIIELAHAAGELSTEKKITCLKDITWLSPVVAGASGIKLYTRLHPVNEHVEYEVYSEGHEEVVHGRGILSIQMLVQPTPFDIASIRKRLKHTTEKTDWYASLKARGFHLGKSFQGIETHYYSQDEALSKISLPHEDGYVLVPGLIDSALQNCLGWVLATSGQRLALPFSVREALIYKELPATIWSYARKSTTNKAGQYVDGYDIDLLNDEGEVLLGFRDFVFLPLRETSLPMQAENNIVQLYETCWLPAEEKKENSNTKSAPLVLLAGGSPVLADKLKEILEIEVEAMDPDTEEAGFMYVFNKVKQALQRQESTQIIVVCRNVDYLQYGFLGGLLKTASLEQPQVTGKIIGVEDLAISGIGELSSIIEYEQHTNDIEVRYINGVRELKTTRLITGADSTVHATRIKEGGVYLITGGMGALGQIFARHISSIKNTRLILTGRNELPKENAVPGIPNAEYIRCNVGDMEAVTSLIAHIKERYSKLDGIIHCAGLIRDSLILNKTREEVRAVLEPKIAGVKNLDRATRNEALDFIVLFSSIAGLKGNAGQCDYASANAYLDAYAHFRNHEWARGQRYGKTISINWPLWQEGGMLIDKEVAAYLERQWGMLPLPAEEGIRAFETFLGKGTSQGLVMFGSESRINAKLFSQPTRKQAPASPQAHSKDLQDQAVKKVTTLAAQLLKLDANVIQNDKELGAYGFDSVLFTKLCNALNEYYDLSLLPVVFYNYPTVERFAAFLADEHAEELSRQHQAGAQPVQEKLKDYNGQLALKKARFIAGTQRPEVDQALEPIAIVGMSGRFPGSPDLESFWKNLKENKDLITEIPADRWDWKNYYGDPLQEKNKTRAKWGGFIEDIDKFDPLFFGISPLEAELMDPQQRITLQAVYEALENAAISPDSIKGSTAGVFIGVSGSDYSLLINSHTGLAGEAQFATGSAHSMLVNRISYLLDIHGPSQPIDTACSSSLVAIHRAVESMRSGQCNLAIAGGVNALLSPELTLSFSQAGMLSEDGRCKTFDQSANGYVRGEGVGVIVLKPLSRAEADGDIIYGVIRGTAENHGGRANTLTSPNPQAQKELLLKAYRSAGVDPGQVSYIEAHGTGTSLGDPIETEALKLAFKELYKDKGLEAARQSHCAVGSVKTNIGHLESAAGIAGVIKVLLSLKHKTLPGNPHLKEPNAYLKLQGTPFYLQKETTDWPAINNQPRIAGISSFGFGGANAHVVIEEYPVKPMTVYTSEQAAIVTLSAKNANRLKEQASRLSAYLHTASAADLHDIAYTLQVGRAVMEERLAIVAHTAEELKTQLENYREDKPGEYITANILANTSLLPKEADESFIKQMAGANEFISIARRWVNGAAIDWNLLYPHQRPARISMFSYSFAKERYWVQPKKTPALHSNGNLHPLLHTNESDLSGQKYLSIFSGKEFFFEDHKVRGVKVLPGAAQLELAREAGERSLRKEINQLRDVVFMSPLHVFDRPQKVSTRLQGIGKEIEFAICDHGNSSHIFSRGKLNSLSLHAPLNENLLLIRQRLKNSMTGDEYYSLLQLQGIDYGAGFRGITSIYYNADEVLSKISLPVSEEFVLPPGLLDSAVQTVMGLSFGFDKNKPLVLPFSVKEVNIYGRLPRTFWSYARRNNKQGAVATYDVQLLDESGKVLVDFKEFFPLPADQQQSAAHATEHATQYNSLLYVPVWDRIKTNGAIFSKDGKHLLLKGDADNETANELKRILLQQHCVVEESMALHEIGEGITDIYLLHGLCVPGGNHLHNGYKLPELSVFHTIKALLASSYKEKNLNITVLTSNTQKVHSEDHVNEAGSGISGLIGSLAKEHPLWNIRIIDLDGLVRSNGRLGKILSVPYDKEGSVVSYRNGHFYRKSLCPVDLPPGKASKLRQGGTYVILGGAGGIGKVTTAYLIKEYNAQVIWIGRRPLNESILQSLDEMEKLGVRPQYISCNAVDKGSLQRAYRMIKASNNAVHGLFHSAIVLNDMLLKNMSEEDFRMSFEPKSLASHYLADVFKEEPLDFICFYSSVQSHLNAAGQANYSAGCTYEDSLAYSIKQSLNIPSHVINWGYWGNEGVVASDEYRQRMRSLGVGGISSRDGMHILETVLSNEMDQVAAIKFA